MNKVPSKDANTILVMGVAGGWCVGGGGVKKCRLGPAIKSLINFDKMEGAMMGPVPSPNSFTLGYPYI